ncbi:MAG: hypothetical protein L6R39_001086 [Caloplaca ligustica]|nr:MAG: hypothetical protein L6R39_001086 [Caloplaca ligustica]
MGRKHKKQGTDSNSTTHLLQSLQPGSSNVDLKPHGESSRASPPVSSDALNPPPAKRQKIVLADPVLPDPAPEASTTPSQASVAAGDVHVPATSISFPAEVQHLHSRYDFSTMSVISSSRINHKVKTLIERVEKFTFADVSAKPGVVILGAKAEVASKMISVVEIAKGDIAKRGGKWYQYSSLRSDLHQVTTKQKQQPRGGRTLANVQCGEGSNRGMNDGLDQRMHPTTRDQMDVDDDDSVEGGEAFEVMQHPSGGAVVSERSKVRAVPIMTIYFSRVPVPGLKDLFG